MRWLVLILSLSFALAAHAQAPDSDYNSTDLSSNNWAREDGFEELSAKRSKAQEFLRAMGQTLMKKPANPPVNETQSTSSGTR
jgi:hypothetical protein